MCGLRVDGEVCYANAVGAQPYQEVESTQNRVSAIRATGRERVRERSRKLGY